MPMEINPIPESNAIENGVYVPSTVLALKISKTLSCKVEDLFQLTE